MATNSMSDVIDYDEEDDDMPPPPKELMTPSPKKRIMSGSSPMDFLTPQMSASTKGGYARYTTPIASIPSHYGTRLSSQRRLPYTPLMNNNAFDSPNTSRMSSFNTPPGRLHRWGLHQRLDLGDSLVSSTNEYHPGSDFERLVKRLQTKLATEQNRLRDAKTTIQYWRKREANQQSWNEIYAHALLLLSEIRIKTYQDLISRLTGSLADDPLPVALGGHSVFTVYRVDIALSREYYLKSNSYDPNYVFILVGSTGAKTVASQLVEVSESELLRSRRFRIDEEMVFKNLPANFQIYFSVYVMKVEHRARTPKAFAKKMAASLFSKFTPSIPNHNTSIGSRNDENIVTAFELAGSFNLTEASTGHYTVFFDDPMYPLDGSADVNSKVFTH